MIVKILRGSCATYVECDSVRVSHYADSDSDNQILVVCEAAGGPLPQQHLVDKNVPEAVWVGILRGPVTDEVELFSKPEDADG